MSDRIFHTCSYCGGEVEVTEARNPSKVAELLLAHIKLTCTGVPGAVTLGPLAEATASAELAGATPPAVERDATPEDFYAHWDLVSVGGVLLHTHHERQCRPPCVIHSPSAHHMREWQAVWSQAFRTVLRICPHDHYHPDPDDLQARTGKLQHTCDGCCLPPR